MRLADWLLTWLFGFPCPWCGEPILNLARHQATDHADRPPID